MKNKSLNLILLLVITCCSKSNAIVVQTVGELLTAVRNSEPRIELNAARFDLTSNLVIQHDCNILPHPERSGQGGVIIDGKNSYLISFQSATINVGCDDPNNILKFTNGSGESVSVISYTKQTCITFNYCDFYNPVCGDGLSMLDGDYKLTVICNDCQANYNYADGFSLQNYGGSALVEHTVILNNCTAMRNGLRNPQNYCGDGATSHNENQILNINGGLYCNNGKTGVAMVGGSKCYITNDAKFYNNGGLITNFADVYASEKSYIEIVGVKLKNLNYPQAGFSNVWLTDSYLKMQDCVINNPLGTEGSFVYCIGNSTVQIENCIFSGKPSNISSIKLSPNTKGFIKNCTFYSNNCQINMPGVSGLSITNNIFKDANQCALLCTDNAYSMNSENGFNCFYGNAENLYEDTGNLFSTDIITDPLFADEKNGDFHHKSQAGRWQEAAQDRDIMADGFVNLLDFAKFLSVWKESRIPVPVNYNKDLAIDIIDFSMLVEEYLTQDYEYDLTGDNFVNLLDVAVFLQEWDRFKTLLFCDFDKDGKITLKDLSLLIDKNYYLIWQNPDRWFKDDVTSPCIDAGNPEFSWQNEPWPNGARINIGAYGNTLEASKSVDK